MGKKKKKSYSLKIWTKKEQQSFHVLQKNKKNNGSHWTCNNIIIKKNKIILVSKVETNLDHVFCKGLETLTQSKQNKANSVILTSSCQTIRLFKVWHIDWSKKWQRTLKSHIWTFAQNGGMLKLLSLPRYCSD